MQGDDVDYLDDDNYPTDHALERVKAWTIKGREDAVALLDFVRDLWAYPDYFDIDASGTYQVSTAGWSGNESLIDALGSNSMFWTLCWKSSKRGGHYQFDLERFPKTKPVVCGKRCDHGSECMQLAGHQPADRHETQHGCVFYDVKVEPSP